MFNRVSTVRSAIYRDALTIISVPSIYNIQQISVNSLNYELQKYVQFHQNLKYSTYIKDF